MGAPVIPLIGLGLQAAGLVTQIMGGQEDKKKREEAARKQATRDAWANLISIAGGGG